MGQLILQFSKQALYSNGYYYDFRIYSKGLYNFSIEKRRDFKFTIDMGTSVNNILIDLDENLINIKLNFIRLDLNTGKVD